MSTETLWTVKEWCDRIKERPAVEARKLNPIYWREPEPLHKHVFDSEAETLKQHQWHEITYEITYGARWMNTPSPGKYQIWRMECCRCYFYVEPTSFLL